MKEWKIENTEYGQIAKYYIDGKAVATVYADMKLNARYYVAHIIGGKNIATRATYQRATAMIEKHFAE